MFCVTAIVWSLLFIPPHSANPVTCLTEVELVLLMALYMLLTQVQFCSQISYFKPGNKYLLCVIPGFHGSSNTIFLEDV